MFVDQGGMTSAHSPNQKFCKDSVSVSAISIPKRNRITAIFFNDIGLSGDDPYIFLDGDHRLTYGKM
jgi:hypothetical protein